jgi:hypothetical protein
MSTVKMTTLPHVSQCQLARVGSDARLNQALSAAVKGFTLRRTAENSVAVRAFCRSAF